MSDRPETLLDYLRLSATRRPSHVAVEEVAGDVLTYAELDLLSDRVRDRLHRMGVGRGDRVGIYVRKSIDAYAALLGAMKAGAAYVPVDAAAPPWRAAFILRDCAVKVVVLEQTLLAAWREENGKLGFDAGVIVLDAVGGGAGLGAALDALDAQAPAPPAASAAVEADDLAYVLYTSGSTGLPKGVMLTHRNAVAFVEWCARVLAPDDADRFSSHAPFHFDLSILDLYLPLRQGATVLLIGAEAGKEPQGLATLIAERRLTVWYSTPTILTLLSEHGRMERHDYGALRLVCFAGEVFPPRHLHGLMRRWPGRAFYNLYGPTETNVCTYYRIPDSIDAERTVPYPIGRVCEHLRARVVDAVGRDVGPGEEGELVIAGDNVNVGYWNLPERTVEAFLVDEAGVRWYRTGDVVVEDGDGVFTFLGRRDRMIKRRGYRIELGEIEAALYRHAAVREAAAVTVTAPDGAVLIRAVIALGEGGRRSVIEFKGFCHRTLPAYMVPDQIQFIEALPKTSTDKVDYQRLATTG